MFSGQTYEGVKFARGICGVSISRSGENYCVAVGI